MSSDASGQGGPRVRAVGWTSFVAPDGVDWTTDADGGDALGEFAGRACYRSWDKPNPVTATNAGYLHHLIDVGHSSALEHASVTLYVTGISRSVAHELMRHRHLSFSQLSQRNVPRAAEDFVEPAAIAADPGLHRRFVVATQAAAEAHAELLAGITDSGTDAGAGDGSARAGHEDTLRRKQARQAVRSLFPEAARTDLVVTGNLRAWRHVIAARGAEHADAQMRELTVLVVRELRRIAPNSFADFDISALPDGSEVVASPLAGGG